MSGQSLGMAAALAAIAAVAGPSEPLMQACARLMNWAEAKPRIVNPASQRRDERT
jgi:hypothetical protein